MSTESVTWWAKDLDRGVVVESSSFSDEGTVDGVSGAIPEGASVLTEPEFAALLREDYLHQFDAWQGARALKAAAIAQVQTERQAKVDELVTIGLSEQSAESMVPPAPVLDMSENYEPPPGAAEHLRSAYRLSQESIDAILAPIEEP